MTKKNNKQTRNRGSQGFVPSHIIRPVNQQINEARRNIPIRKRSNQIRPTKTGLVACNAEKFAAVNGSSTSGTFLTATLPLNPASAAFPWLQRLTANYALYRWKRLRILYVSSVGSTVNGTVGMGCFYDIQDALAWGANSSPLINLSMVENSTSGPVWSSTLRSTPNGLVSEMMCDLDVSRIHARTPWFRVAPSVATTNTADFNQAVAVNLGYSTNYTGTGNQAIGDIWVDYEIEFSHSNWNNLGTTFLVSPYDSGFRMYEHKDTSPGHLPLLEECMRKLLPIPESDPMDISE